MVLYAVVIRSIIDNKNGGWLIMRIPGSHSLKHSVSNYVSQARPVTRIIGRVFAYDGGGPLPNALKAMGKYNSVSDEVNLIRLLFAENARTAENELLYRCIQHLTLFRSPSRACGDVDHRLRHGVEFLVLCEATNFL